MKRLIILLLLLPSLALAQGGMGPGPGVKGYTAPASCTTTVATYNSSLDTDKDIGASNNTRYAGLQILDNVAGKCICKVGLSFGTRAGNIDGKSFTAVIYKLDGATFAFDGAALGTSAAVLGSALTDGAMNYFTFSPCVTMAGAGGNDYAIVVTMGETDAANYASLKADTASNPDGGYSNACRWNNTGARYNNYTYDFGYILYE